MRLPCPIEGEGGLSLRLPQASPWASPEISNAKITQGAKTTNPFVSLVFFVLFVFEFDIRRQKRLGPRLRGDERVFVTR